MQRHEHQTEGVEEATNTLSGWTTKYAIAALSGIVPGIPSYEELCDAAVAGFEERDSSNEGLKAKGVKEYKLKGHTGLTSTKDFTNRSSGVEASGDVASSSLVQALSDLGMTTTPGGSSSSGPQVELADWLQSYLNTVKSAEKLLSSCEGMQSTAQKTLLSLESQSKDSKLMATLADELNGKFTTFQNFTKEWRKACLDQFGKKSKDDCQGSEKMLDTVIADSSDHLENFKTYLRKLKQFMA